MPDGNAANMASTGSKLPVRGLAGRLSGYFEGLDERSKPLPPYTATLLERSNAVCAALWLALQGAYLHKPALLPGDWWFGLCVCSALAAFVFADRLSRNRPRASAIMQLAAILGMGVGLVQGGQLELVSSRYLWILPALALPPVLYLALKRNLESFAFAGYAIALALPFPAGIAWRCPALFFGYYFLLCLPLPLLTLLRPWRYLNICALAWIFGSLGYFLVTAYEAGDFERTQIFLTLFLTCYFVTLWARIFRAPFSVLHFPDFLFSVGLATGAALCQLRISMLYPDGILPAVLFLALVFGAVSILGRLSWGERGRSLSRIYLFISAALLNSLAALIWPGGTALGVYCLQAVLLFWLGSAAEAMSLKAGGFIVLLLTPIYFLLTEQYVLGGSLLIAAAALACAFVQDRELKRLARRSGRKPWSSRLEFFLVAFGFVWCFGGLLVFAFRDMPAPGPLFFALSSACAYVFFAVGKFVRLRSLRVAIFIPMLISIPAVLLPFAYQTRIEWPEINHLVSYNYLSGIGALAWVAYFITVWTALYHNWGGLISKRVHAWLLALVTLELVLVLTSSSRAFALESGVSPSFLSVLAVLPGLGCIFVISRQMKVGRVERPYRAPMLLAVPWVLFGALGLWFVFSLSSPGDAAPGGKYVPLLNPVELVQLLSILIFGYWQRRLRKASFSVAHLSGGLLLWVYGVSSFLWLHGVMFRVVQYFSQAQAREVLGFVELHIIFACIWVAYGILAWLGSSIFTSTFSWLTGAILLAAGSGALAYLALGLWGQFVAVVVGLGALVILTLLIWRSPAPFTARGRRFAEQAY